MEFSFGSIKLGTRAGEAAPATPSEETPFRIAILGDFSGKGTRRGRAPDTKVSGLRPIPIDRDNFEAAMARLGVELTLSAGDAGQPISLRFKELDDFRPERVYAQVSAFDTLRETRRKLSNPATFAAAAQELRGLAKPEPAPPSAPSAAAAAPLPTGEALLDAVLGATPQRRDEPSGGGPDLTAFLRKAVAGHVIREDPRQAELLDVVDRATSGLMRALLHHPDFQALESLWRGLYFLVRRLDTDAQLKLFLIDVSQAELVADLATAEDLASTGIYRLLVEQTVGTPGAPPWAVLVGHYSFDPSVADVELLGRISLVAQRAGAPFLAAASPSVLGCKSFGQTPDPDDWQPLSAESAGAWGVLQSLPSATYLGLVAPRFLLRLPYGKQTDPVEAFEFEEMPGGNAHEAYLWGNPAIAAAHLLGEAFSRRGWDMRPGMVQDIDNVPAHIYEADGESEMKPCAEVLLTRRALDRFAERGLMPLLSVQGRDSVQLGAFRSLSAAQPGLAGRWGASGE
jgi:type VI secretion system protein ImpC